MHVLEKSLQAAVVGGMFGGATKMAGNVAQIHRAPIHQTTIITTSVSIRLLFKQDDTIKSHRERELNKVSTLNGSIGK